MKLFLIFLMGASIGSFLGVVIDRFPDTSLLFPASQCNYCHKRLRWFELIPILSQVALGSKCRHCHAPIPFWYAGLEGTVAVLVILATQHILSIGAFLLILSGVVLGLYDLKHREYPLLVWCFFTALLLFFLPVNILFFFLILLAILATYFPIKIGAGDFLFLASLSLYFSLHQLLWIVLLASLVGILSFLWYPSKRLPFVPYLLLASLVMMGIG